MRDRSLIYAGLILFLALVTFPFTYNIAAGVSSKSPNLKLPERAKQCVAPVDYMKSSHMQLLRDWRENAVRRNLRVYVASDGRQYATGLTGACLTECHENKAEFCNRCHSYVGVRDPYCMDCHVDPGMIERSGR